MAQGPQDTGRRAAALPPLLPLLLGAAALLAACKATPAAPAAPGDLGRVRLLVGAAVRGSLLARLADELPAVDASGPCARQARRVVRDALDGQLWALHWVDASARLPAGLLSGNVNQLGDYDECLSVEPPGDHASTATSYCLASVTLDLPDDVGPGLRQAVDLLQSHSPLRSNFSHLDDVRLPRFSAAYLAVCAPAACSADELQSALQRVLNDDVAFSASMTSTNTSSSTTSSATFAPFRVSLRPELCRKQNQEPEAEGLGAGLARAALRSFLVAVIVATIVDVVCLNGDDPAGLPTWVNCLSLRRNWRRLISLPDPSKTSDVAALHGSRGLSALGLMVAHKGMAMHFEPFANRTLVADAFSRPWSAVGRTAALYTDGFVLLSGALAAVSLLRRLDRTGGVAGMALLRRLADRYVRLMPLLAAVVALCTLELPRLGGGPLWGVAVEPYAAVCRRSWWRGLLFVHNNYYGLEDMCLPHTHQLGTDTQLFLAAPLLVFPLWRWPRAGALLLAALAAWSAALRHAATLEHKLSYYLYSGEPISQIARTVTLSYFLPSHRLTVYIMGVALGHALHRVPESFRFSRVWAALGWLAAPSLGLLAVLGPYEAAAPAFRYDAVQAARYAALAPVLWSVFVGWVTFASSRGSGSWFRDLLCWRGWVIFTRIAFAVYLVQFPVFFYNIGSNRHAQFGTIYSLLNIGDFAFIMMASVVLSLTFEMPFQELWKAYEERRKGKAKQASDSTLTLQSGQALRSVSDRKSD